MGASFKPPVKPKKNPFDVIWASKSKENDDCGALSPLKIPIPALLVS